MERVNIFYKVKGKDTSCHRIL